jgi:hypothetical protein
LKRFSFLKLSFSRIWRTGGLFLALYFLKKIGANILAVLLCLLLSLHGFQ